MFFGDQHDPLASQQIPCSFGTVGTAREGNEGGQPTIIYDELWQPAVGHLVASPFKHSGLPRQ